MSTGYQAAPPLNLARIEESAWEFRQRLGAGDERYFPVEWLFERMHLLYGDEAHFEIRDRELMGDCHALADPDRKMMFVRNDVYEGLHRHAPFARFTVTHEFGHFTLHPNLMFARRFTPQQPRPFECPEWQANAWAGSVLVPRRFVSLAMLENPDVIAREFGVTRSAALTRVAQIQRSLGLKQNERPGLPPGSLGRDVGYFGAAPTRRRRIGHQQGEVYIRSTEKRQAFLGSCLITG